MNFQHDVTFVLEKLDTRFQVIETIMYNTIAKFLETKSTIHDCQFGSIPLLHW